MKGEDGRDRLHSDDDVFNDRPLSFLLHWVSFFSPAASFNLSSSIALRVVFLRFHLFAIINFLDVVGFRSKEHLFFSGMQLKFYTLFRLNNSISNVSLLYCETGNYKINLLLFFFLPHPPFEL